MITSIPFFSICVATRNRSETLYYCLKTLLHQDFEAYEIIVSDNCDEEESAKTFKIIEELNSPKLKYFKPPRILSMTENYEFALSKAQGQYILCMGDDDGLIVDSLQYVYKFIQQYKATVVKCPGTWYFWINSSTFPESQMVFPTPRPVISIDSRSILEKVARFELGYFNLPMIYYSFVSRTIVDNAIKEKGSFFQDTTSIDMYSGLIIAHKTTQFYVADKPFVVVGVSKKSNGASWSRNESNNITKEFQEQHSLYENLKKFQVPILPRYYTSTYVMMEIKRFAENYNLGNNDLQIGSRKILLNFLSKSSIIDNIKTVNFAEDFRQYDIYKEDIAFIEKNFLDNQVYFPFLENDDIQLVQREGIDPNLFGIKNVYDAAVIFRKLIDGAENLKPVKIHINKPSALKKPILVKRAYHRIKKAINVLLNDSL